MSSNVIEKITDAVKDLERFFSSYELLLMYAEKNDPDLTELTALGAVLHSFYNGVEGIFHLVAKLIDDFVPSDSTWHFSLLKQMTEKTTTRKPLISEDTANVLRQYIRFRHFFRHAYAFRLDWIVMKPLVHDVEDVWSNVKREMKTF